MADLEFSLDEISSELARLGVHEHSPTRLAAIKADLDQLIARDLELPGPAPTSPFARAPSVDSSSGWRSLSPDESCYSTASVSCHYRIAYLNSLLNNVTRLRSCSDVTRGFVSRICICPPGHEERLGVLIGAGGTRRSDWPERV